MSLLQRRHYNHLAEMSSEIRMQCEKLDPHELLTTNIKRIIVYYMKVANPNFNEYRFLEASGWLDEPQE